MWHPRRLVSWLALGGTAAFVELVLVALLYDGLDAAIVGVAVRTGGLGWPLPVATAVAAEVLILLKFAIADRWIFGHARPTVGRLVRYHGASLGALVAYWVVANACALVLGLSLAVAFVVGTGVAFAWSLLTNFLWVWAPREGARPAPSPATPARSRTAPPA